MKNIDIRFDNNTLDVLQSLVGKQMDEFACCRLEYTPMVYGIVIFKVDGELYSLTNTHTVMDYMNKVDDVGVFKFGKTDENTIERFLEGASPINTPVNQRISEIRIMNENQQLFHNGVQTYDVYTVRGIVFVMDDGREVSAEKGIWFSEMINVRTGHSLMDKYESMDDFMDNWDEYPEYQTKGSREVVVIK
ncbi:MAG: hypothetical protein LUC91_05790 [Prevotella sp.]|nr:hypothetical protein [Prevotella sp.]